jgi:hypothetical protein
MGVDGVVTGSLLVHEGRLLLCAKLSSLADESIEGLWVEESVDKGLATATDALAAKLEPIVHAWARGLRARRVEAGAARTRRLNALKEVASSPWVVALEEHFDRDYRLFAGVAEASVIEVLRQAGGSVRVAGDAGGPVAPGSLQLRGTAHCTVPVHRDGRSVARAVCSLRLEGDGGAVLDDATVVRSFAALQAREAGYAALQAAGEAAALALLERHGETLRRRAELGLAPQKPSRSPAAKPETSATAVEQPTLRSDDEALRRLNAAATPFERLAALQGTALPFDVKIKEVETTLRRLPDPQRDVPGALCLELAQGYADRGRWAEGFPWLARMRDSRNPVVAGPKCRSGRCQRRRPRKSGRTSCSGMSPSWPHSTNARASMDSRCCGLRSNCVRKAVRKMRRRSPAMCRGSVCSLASDRTSGAWSLICSSHWCSVSKWPADTMRATFRGPSWHFCRSSSAEA